MRRARDVNQIIANVQTSAAGGRAEDSGRVNWKGREVGGLLDERCLYAAHVCVNAG